jgi:ActR/RegA family two-component response regulator
MEARRQVLDWFQDRYVLQLLELHDQNVSAAARAAGLDRRSIQRVLARHRQRGDP